MQHAAAHLGPACFAAAVRARSWPSATTRPRSPRWQCLCRGDRAHGCWGFRVASKHSHCLGWRISVWTALMA